MKKIQAMVAVSLAVMLSVLGVCIVGSSDNTDEHDVSGVGSAYPISVTATMNPGDSLKSAVTKALGNKTTSDIGTLTIVTSSTAILSSDDFEYIRSDIQFLSALDLSKAQLAGNVIPDYAMSYYSGYSNPLNVIFPSTLKAIGNHAFDGTPLAASSTNTYTIPKTVTSIGDYAFSESFTSSSKSTVNTVVIPTALSTIESNPFASCTSVKAFSMSGSGTYSVSEGVLYTSDMTHLVCFPAGMQGLFTVPKTVTTIESYAFQGSQGFSGINLNLVKSIGSYAFLSCSTPSPISIKIPDTVTYIGDNPFSRFSTLQSISVSEKSSFRTSDGVLYDSSRLSTLISYPALKSGDFSMPASVTKIGNSAFEGAIKIGKLTLSKSNNLSDIGNYAFVTSSVSGDLVIPRSVTHIGAYAFCYCDNLTSVTISSSMKTIDTGAFWGSGISKLTIEENSKESDGSESSTSIGDYAFYGCDNLKGALYIPGNVKTIGVSAFDGYVGITSLKLAEGIKSIGNHAFDNCGSLTGSLIIPSTASVGSYAFAHSGITSLTISEGITSVGTYAFFNNISLRGMVTIPSTLSDVSEGMFSDCYGITGLNIKFGVQTIGDRAFNRCSAMTGMLLIPSSITGLGTSSFEECTALQGVYLSQDSGLSVIGNNAFYGCNLTGELVLPMSVTSIGGGSFENSDGLVISITSAYPSVGANAFSQNATVYVTVRFVSVNVDQNAFGTGNAAVMTIVATSGGTVTPSRIILCGTDITYTLTPDQGYEVSNITINGADVDIVSPLTIKNTGIDEVVHVTFIKSIVYYNITSESGLGGTISPSGMNRVESGYSITFNMIPDEGYHIAKVNVDGVSIGTSASYTYQNVSASSMISVVFEKDVYYTVNANAGNGGMISPSGLTSVISGGSVTFSISADPGYYISAVTVNGNVIGSVSNYTFSDMSNNCTINAIFSAIVVYYTLNASAGVGGNISDAGVMSVPAGWMNTYTIIPDTGHLISDVKVDGISVGAVSQYIFSDVAANHIITASFEVITYTISINESLGGKITGSTSVGYGSDDVMTVTPDSGYHIVDVQVDGVSVGAVSSYTFRNVSSSGMISAIFAPNTVSYTIVASATYGGTISPSGTMQMTNLSSQTFNMEPLPAYFISDVQVNGVSVGAVSSYTISNPTSDVSISVSFSLVILAYDITATEGPGGLISPLGKISMNSNGTQIFYITPNSGYYIVDVKVNGTSVGAVSTYTFNGISRDSTIDAIFAQIVPTYTVMASAGPGGIISPNGQTTVSAGSSQVYTITPESGYHVVDVKVNGTSVGAVSTYTFSGPGSDSSIYATFAVDTVLYNISSSASTGGTISPAGVISVTHDSSTTYTMTSKPGYVISSVIVNGVNIGAVSSYTFTNVSGYCTIRANFATEVFDIFVSSNGNGTVSPIGDTYLSRGGSLTVNMVADSGYHIKSVFVDGVNKGAISSYAFSDISSNHTVFVTFDSNIHTISASSGPGGSVRGAGAYGYGSTMLLKAIPNEGYRFESWSDGVINGSREVVVNSDMELHASFVAIPVSDMIRSVEILPSAEDMISDLAASKTGVRYVISDMGDRDYILDESVFRALHDLYPGKVVEVEFRDFTSGRIIYSVIFNGYEEYVSSSEDSVDVGVEVMYSTLNPYVADSVFLISPEDRAVFVSMGGSGKLPYVTTISYNMEEDSAGEEYGLYVYNEDLKSLVYLNQNAVVSSSGELSFDVSQSGDYVLVLVSSSNVDDDDGNWYMIVLIVCGLLMALAVIWFVRKRNYQ